MFHLAMKEYNTRSLAAMASEDFQSTMLSAVGGGI